MTHLLNTKLLIVAVETNAANYLYPLLSKWLIGNNKLDWKIFAGPYAEKRLTQDNDRIPIIKVNNSYDAFEEAYQAISASGWEPDALLVSAAGHPLEFAAMAAMAGKPRTQFIDTWTNYKKRFEGPDGLVVGEQIFVINEHARKEAVSAGLPNEKIVITGQPSWELVSLLPPPSSPHNVLFLSAPILEGYGQSLGYTENDCWDLVLKTKQTNPGLFDKLFFAPHPVETPPTPLKLKDAILIQYDQLILEQVGTVLGMFSSPMVDAFLAGRHVISIQPGSFGEDACPLSRHDFISRVATPEQLAKAMQNPVLQKNKPLIDTLASSTSRLDEAITTWLSA